MFENFLKGEVPSIFETTIKREKGQSSSDTPNPPKLKEYRNEDEFLRSVKATLCYCGSFLTFGMAAAVIGPTLLELGCVSGRKVNAMSWVFFSQALSALFGSCIGGCLADRYDCNVVLLVCVTAVSMCLAVIPVCSVFSVMLAFFALLGVHMGVIDTVANSVLIKIHGKKVAPRLQALHFFYGLGALLSPVISEPFLRNACEGGHFEKNIFGWTLENSTLMGQPLAHFAAANFTGLNFTMAPVVQVVERNQNGSYVQYAYWLICFLQLPVQAGIIYLIYCQRYIRRRSPVLFNGTVVDLSASLPKRNSAEANSGQELSQIFKPVEHLPPKSSLRTLPAKVPLLVAQAALLLFFMDGLQGAYGGYLFTYALKSDVHFTPSHGAFLTSLFWCLFAVGRFISIPVSMFVSPDSMLLGNLLGCFAAVSCMLYLHLLPMSLWVGSSVFGLFLSSVFPSTLAFAEKYIDVSGSLTSILIVSSASGEMLIPLLVGKAFTRDGPLSFLIIGFLLCVLALLIYFMLRVIARARLAKPLSEMFYSLFNWLCMCNSTYERYFDSDECEYTQMVPCDQGTEGQETHAGEQPPSTANTKNNNNNMP